MHGLKRKRIIFQRNHERSQVILKKTTQLLVSASHEAGWVKHFFVYQDVLFVWLLKLTLLTTFPRLMTFPCWKIQNHALSGVMYLPRRERFFNQWAFHPLAPLATSRHHPPPPASDECTHRLQRCNRTLAPRSVQIKLTCVDVFKTNQY